MIPKHDLHQLIKSLSASEKRYFKIVSEKHVIGTKNNYIRLFNYIDAMNNYDEKQLKSVLINRKSRLNLSVEKVNLKALILKSLTAFHAQKSVDINLYEKLIQIEILYDKGLYNIGLALINKAIEQTIKYEKLPQHMALLVWKVNFETKLNNGSELLRGIDELNNTAIAFQSSLKFMRGAFELITLMNLTGSKENEIKLEATFKKIKRLQQEKPPQTVLGKYYYYSLKGFICDRENNTKEALINFAKIISVFSENPYFTKERPNLYLIVINNYVVALIELNKFDLALKTLVELAQFATENKLTGQLGARAFLILSENNLVVYSKTERVDEALVFIKEIELSLQKHTEYIDFNRKLDLYYSLFSVYFQAKQYKKANTWLNKILNQKHATDVKIDLISLCMISQLILMIDADDLLLFEGKFSRTKRFIESKTTLGLFTSALQILQILYTNKSTVNKKQKLKNYLVEFKKQFKNSSSHASISFFFDLEAWLENKIERLK